MQALDQAIPQAVAAPARADRAPAALVALSLMLFGLASLPLLLVESPPLFDYANHLARVHILANLETVDAFRNNYAADSLLLPNVLADLVLLALQPWLGILGAGKALLMLVLALTIGGAAALGWAASGRPTPWPLLAAALVWNEVTIWGFLNYILGLALLLWGLAAWLWLGRRSRGWQLAAGALFALLAFLSHMVAFGLFAIAIAVLELHRAWVHRAGGIWPALRRLAVSAAIFVPALALFLARSPASGLALDMRFLFTDWQKLSPFTRLLATGHTVLDLVTLLAVAGAVLGLLASGRARLHPGLALVALAFLAAEMLLPFSAMGSFFLDMRVAIAAVLLLVVALAPMPGRASPGLARAFCLGLVLLVGVRSAVLADSWIEADRRFAAVKESLKELPPGAFLVAADAAPFELGNWLQTRRTQPPHEHTAGYAVILRDAVLPNVFARRGQNPLTFDPGLHDLWAVAYNPISRATTDAELASFVAHVDNTTRAIHAAPGRAGFPGVYLVVFNRGCADWPETRPVEPVACGPDHALMRVPPPDDGSDAPTASTTAPTARSSS